MLPLLLACGADRLRPEPLAEPADLYWDLELNHHAVTLSMTAPYNTLTLAATPRNYQREPLEGLPAPQYRTTDPDQVQVTPEGVLIGIKPTPAAGAVNVIATLTVGNLKHEDTVRVRVVDNPAPPVLGSLSIDPVPPDSAKTSAGGGLGPLRYNLTTRLLRAADTAGVPLTGLLVAFDVSDTTIASLTLEKTGLLPKRVGTVEIYASATVFGVTKADTLPFRVGWPIYVEMALAPVEEGSLVNRFSFPKLSVGVGATIFWSSPLEVEADVVFADPTNVASMPTTAPFSAPEILPQLAAYCQSMQDLYQIDCNASGNFVIPPYPPHSFNFIGRGFPVPGTYEYRSTLHGASGKIVVIDER